MTAYNGYVFFLCLIVFLLFTAVFTVMIVSLIRFYLKLIRLGAEDEKIIIEYEKAKTSKKKSSERVLEIVGFAITLLLAALLLAGCVASSVIGARETSRVGRTPSLKVVMSASMSYKEPDNEYLFENGLNDQVKTFDLIVMRELPPEEELKLYDVVSYEINGELVLHRIVGIEEPSEKHPEERWFLMQGDAVHLPDKFPVRYESMRGIYRGTRIAAVGSFFVFMRSPAGLLSILLILFACVATPIAERKIQQAKDERYAIRCPSEITAEEIEEPFSALQESKKPDIRAFREKITKSPPQVRKTYLEISRCLSVKKNIKISYSATSQTFKLGKRSVARLIIRNNVLSIALNLDPKQYAHIKGSFSNRSGQASFASFPMVIKLISPHKVELAKELIADALEGKHT